MTRSGGRSRRATLRPCEKRLPQTGTRALSKHAYSRNIAPLTGSGPTQWIGAVALDDDCRSAFYVDNLHVDME